MVVRNPGYVECEAACYRVRWNSEELRILARVETGWREKKREVLEPLLPSTPMHLGLSAETKLVRYYSVEANDQLTRNREKLCTVTLQKKNPIQQITLLMLNIPLFTCHNSVFSVLSCDHQLSDSCRGKR